VTGIVDALLQSDESAVVYKTLTEILDRDAMDPEVAGARGRIPSSVTVRALLAERQPDGTLPHHPYNKWRGAHWVLALLADLDYPPGDVDLIPMREQVLAWLLSEQRRDDVRRVTKPGLPRMHASIEGNALYFLMKLGLADERLGALVERLLACQWPDGGWNCDRKPEAHVSSFHESLLPLRGLAWYGRATDDARVRGAVARVAEVFLQRRLFRRLTDGSIIDREFVRLHYPAFWHYDFLMGLRVMDEAGFLGDLRCAEALDLLETKRSSDSGFPTEGKYYHVRSGSENGSSAVDWGGTSVRHFNPFVTVEALIVLKHAGRPAVGEPGLAAAALS
jgi:hypothetical protein